MKTRIITILLLAMSAMAFAQKKELKTAKKALDKQDYVGAMAALKAAKTNGTKWNDKYQAQYDLYTGQAMYQTGAALDAGKLKGAMDAYKAVQANAAADADMKSMATTALSTMRADIINSAVSDQENENYVAAADKLEMAARLNAEDTIMMYYAANNYKNANDLTKAVKLYEELDGLGFTGIETTYTATNPVSGEVEYFDTLALRNEVVTKGGYTNPNVEVSESKRGEIIKNIALIYINQGKKDEALKAIQNAKAQYPDDLALLESEANIYLELGNMTEYKRAVGELIKQKPDDHVLYFNLGVTSQQSGEKQAAMDMYKKVLQIKPDYYGANINLGNLLIEDDQAKVEEMNALGNSKKDFARYDEIQADRKATFQKAIPYFETALASRPGDESIMRALIGMYGITGDREKAKAMKAKL